MHGEHRMDTNSPALPPGYKGEKAPHAAANAGKEIKGLNEPVSLHREDGSVGQKS